MGTSEEYSDLIQHLMSSSSTGNKAQWEKHAAEIAKALKSNGGNDMDVETAAPDGSSRIRTSRTVHDNGRGTVTKTTKTESTVVSSSSDGASIAGAAHALPGHDAHAAAHAAHMAAHEAAVRAAQNAHKK